MPQLPSTADGDGEATRPTAEAKVTMLRGLTREEEHPRRQGSDIRGLGGSPFPSFSSMAPCQQSTPTASMLAEPLRLGSLWWDSSSTSQGPWPTLQP